MLGLSQKLPNEKELVPSFYEERNLIRHMNTWLKVGYEFSGYFWGEVPGGERFVRQYNLIEAKSLLQGPTTMPGYVLISIPKLRLGAKVKRFLRDVTDRFSQQS